MISFVWTVGSAIRLGCALAVIAPAGAALWQASRCPSRMERWGLRLAGLALLIHAVVLTLRATCRFDNPALGSSLALIQGWCIFGAIGGAWLCAKNQVPSGPGLLRLRRWFPCAGLTIVFGLGWLIVADRGNVAAVTVEHVSVQDGPLGTHGPGTLGEQADSVHGLGSVTVGDQPKAWEQAASRRFSAGLPVLLGAALVIGVLVALSARP